jgi:hypothetical protein
MTAVNSIHTEQNQVALIRVRDEPASPGGRTQCRPKRWLWR